MMLPDLAEAEQLLREAEAKNPGGWADHSRYVAQAAQHIANAHPALDAQAAYIMGLLHDIGRQDNPPATLNLQESTDLRHVLDGYTFLETSGFKSAARICLTHSFPEKHLTIGRERQLDISEAERAFLERFLAQTTYDDYDRLLQLCDALALPSGFVLIEKRLLDVALRRGVHESTVDKWRKWLALQQYFDDAIGGSIYQRLPGVVENTFGFAA
jgi:putative nucleotidyltransferase with HDIG domain